MRTYTNRWLLLVAAMLAAEMGTGYSPRCLALPPREVVEGALNGRSTTGSSDSVEDGKSVEVSIEAESEEDEKTPGKEIAWLGVSTVEASETLASQLDLSGGVGLVVTYVAHISGAAKAGLLKHDVLVRFDDQSLVHPAQLRKLVRAHKPGDTVKITYYRAGKEKNGEVILGRLASQTGATDDEQRGFQDKLREIEGQLKDLHIDVAIRNQMNAAREALGNLNLDHKKVQEEIRESMEEARQAIREALRNSTNADSALNPVRKILEDLAGTSVVVGNHATVTVRSSGKDARSVVNTDETGTIVLVANPKIHLTAHDKDGHLVFDGEIDNAEERAKVPTELWKRVEPLVEKMNAGRGEDSEH